MNPSPLISLPSDTAMCDTACRLGGHSTPAEAVQQALQWYVEYLHNHPALPQDWQPQSIIDMFGKIDYDETVEFHSPRYANLASISPPNSGGETSVPPSR